MKYFLGLDLALTNNGICLIDEENTIIHKKLLKCKNIETENIIDQIIDYISKLIEEYNPFIYLEGLSYGSSGRSFTQICGVHYSVRYFIYKNFDTELTIIEPTKLKKYITGKGQCKKELMLLQIYKKYGVEFDDNNIADAYGLARMALDKNK